MFFLKFAGCEERVDLIISIYVENQQHLHREEEVLSIVVTSVSSSSFTVLFPNFPSIFKQNI